MTVHTKGMGSDNAFTRPWSFRVPTTTTTGAIDWFGSARSDYVEA